MHKYNIISPTGIKPYREIWALQKDIFSRMVDAKRAGSPIDEETIIFVEHTPVLTLGKHGKPENLLQSEAALAARGIECIRIERGGDITYHGPGQLVVYPIIDLEKHRIGVRRYVEILEEAVIRTIAEYGIKGERIEGASGVWIGKGTANERKICALGVKCTRFITMHGLALNVNTDLDAFKVINPCGFTDKGVTSIARELGRTIPLSDVASRLRHHLLALLS